MPVMHMHQIAGRTAVSVVTPDGQPQTAWIGDVFKAHFEKVIEEGQGWPADAEYKVSVRHHTWPCGWDKECSDHYFTCKSELDAYIRDQHEWAKCEDNIVQIKVYQWDLGPNYLNTVEYGGPEFWANARNITYSPL